MPLLSQLFRGWFYGLVFASALFFAEGVFVALSEPHVALWTAPFNVGVGAPLGFALAAFFAVSVAGWSGDASAQEPVTRRLWRWLWADETSRLARRSAWILTAATLAAIWAGASLLVFNRITSTIVTPLFAGALIIVVQLAMIALLATSSAAIARVLAAAFGWFSGLHRVTGYLVGPGALLVGGGLAGLAAFGAAWFLYPATLRVLPWGFAIGPISGLVAVAIAFVVVEKRRSLYRPVHLALNGLLVVAALFTLFLPMGLQGARQVFVGQSSFASIWYGLLEPRLDFDGDGSIYFYAGGDCAPFDPDRGPHQVEIIGDGIDQNCSGFDLIVNPDDFRPGQKSHPRPSGIAQQPNIILITTDALSFPNTTVGGYERDTTPNLAAWAERATVFETAFSNSTSTRLSMPGLLASKFNSMIPMKDKRVHPYDYDPSVVTIATTLKDKGYRTIHLPGTRYFVRWNGYTRGFDEIDTKTYREAKDRHHTSPELTDSAIRYLEDHDDGDGPIFLWIHYYDHHGPYIMPEGGKVFGSGRNNQDIYDSELHFADQHWAKLLEYVENRWEPEDYLMIFTSDHGEAFDENHPRVAHDFSVYTRPTHVPLIVQGPIGRGRRVEGLAGHIDVLPTLANIVGAEPLEDWVGESLVPVLFDEEPIEKTVIYSLFYIPEAVKRNQDGFEMWGVRTHDLYYYENRRRNERRLVRWREDPLDRIDVSAELPEEAEVYRFVAAEKIQWLRDREKGLTGAVGERAEGGRRKK